MSKETTLVEIHMLQNHVPANLNRDNLGAPKTALFGGTLRARISSQCLKRSIRTAMRDSELFDSTLRKSIGQRTKLLPQLLRDELARQGLAQEQIAPVCERVKVIAKGENAEEEESDELKTPTLIFLAPFEVKEMAAILCDVFRSEPEKFKEFVQNVTKSGGVPKGGNKNVLERLGERLTGHSALDIALFGRMTTSAAFENVEASLEVAHAISTTKAELEVDYFTAVDDAQPKEQTGAGHVGEFQYTSATFYKYFALDFGALVRNLHGKEAPPAEQVKARSLAEAGLAALIRSAALVTPSGKRKGCGHSNPPDAILVEVKPNLVPMNYANAFLVPAYEYSDNAGTHDVMDISVRCLSQYVENMERMYGIKSNRWWCASRPQLAFSVAGTRTAQGMDELVEGVLAAVRDGGKAHEQS